MAPCCPMLGQVPPKLAPSWSQVGPKLAPSWRMWAQAGPTWPKLAPSGPQDGSKLVQVGSCWRQVGPVMAHLSRCRQGLPRRPRRLCLQVVASSSVFQNDLFKRSFLVFPFGGIFLLFHLFRALHEGTLVHTYIHTYIHTCIHTYIHKYIHTYLHMHV